MLRILLLALLAAPVLSETAFTQENCCYSLRGSIWYKSGLPSSHTIISLYKNKDSLRLLSTIADSAGAFRFTGLPQGDYFIGVEISKNKTRLLPQLYKLTQSLDSVRIEIDMAKILEEVVVVSKKPFLQRESDRLVINLENSLLTKGNSLLEAFRKLPGLDVLAGNTITVNGNPDVLIIIDGKSYRSSSAQALQLLNSVRSENVEKIEVFTTPPAKYEAEGTSIINIVLKKDKIYSNVYATYSQKIYPEPGVFGAGLNQFSGGSNLSYAAGKFRFNLRLGIANNSASYTRASYTAVFTDGERINSSLLTSDAANAFVNLNTNFVSGRHTVALGISYNNNFYNRIRSGNQDFFVNNAKQTDSVFQSDIITKVAYNNPVATLSYDYQINKNKGQGISFSAIGGNYRNDYDIEQNILASTSPSTIYFGQQQDYSVSSFAFKIDYTQQTKMFGKIDAGIKRTQLRNKDLYAFTNAAGSRFNFNEDINAAYVSAAKTFRKNINTTAGLRIEQTHNAGLSSLLPGSSLTRDYVDVFPSFSVQYPAGKKSKLNLAYSRRISRPSYNNFNPASYALFNDVLSSQEGNPNLKPQYTSKYELSFQRNTYYGSITYSHNSNVRALLAETSNNRFISYKTVNITGHDVNISSFYSRKLTKWTEANVNAAVQYYYFGMPDNTSVNSVAVRLSAGEAFTINPSLSADISVRYYSPYHMQYWKVGGYYTIDAGFRKTFLKNTLVLTGSINDLTGSSKVVWKYLYPDVTKTVHPLTNERLFNLSLSYRFKTANRFQLKRTASDEFGETRFYK